MRRRGDDVTFTPHEWAVIRILREGAAPTSRFTDPTRRKVSHRYAATLAREGLVEISEGGTARLTQEGRTVLGLGDEPVDPVDEGASP